MACLLAVAPGLRAMCDTICVWDEPSSLTTSAFEPLAPEICHERDAAAEHEHSGHPSSDPHDCTHQQGQAPSLTEAVRAQVTTAAARFVASVPQVLGWWAASSLSVPCPAWSREPTPLVVSSSFSPLRI